MPDPPPLLLLSFDGFRHDYIDRHPAPNLRWLRAAGSSAGRLRTVNISKTLPSHWSLITGAAPASHGLLANDFFSPVDGARFSAKAEHGDERWWQGAEPLWVTAERQGLRTAPQYWPGSDAVVRGVRPTYWSKFPEDRDLNFGRQVARAIGLLALPPERRPSFLTLYSDVVDKATHSAGPDSADAANAVAQADAMLGQLLRALAGGGWLGRANIVVVSDHGMVPVGRALPLVSRLSASELAQLRLAPKADEIKAHGAAILMLRPRRSLAPRRRAALLRAVRRRLDGWEGATLELWPPGGAASEQMGWLHMDCGDVVTLRTAATVAAGAQLERRGLTSHGAFTPAKEGLVGGGAHGYVPERCDPGGAWRGTPHAMDGILLAHGPAFAAGARSAVFPALGVHLLLARALRIEPSAEAEAGDDTERAVRELLRPPPAPGWRWAGWPLLPFFY